MTDVADDLEKDVLRIGDYVMFKDVVRNCFLGVEGILQEDMLAIEGTPSLQDAIFCVHLQRQYSASRDLNAFLQNYNMDVKMIKDEGAKQYLFALQRGRENEKKLNDTYMRKKYGQRVSFGDIIQLFHVKSGKYLTVSPDQLAKIERENIGIMLDVNGNAFSWLQIAPRFKIDKEGDRVLSNSEMYLRAAERGNEFIHSADRDPLPGHPREVNCALESTSWKMKIYQSSSDSLDPSILLASQLVFITDPETRGNLTVAERKIDSVDEMSAANDQVVEINPEEEDFEPKPQYPHPFGDIVIEPPPQDYVNSNFLWFIESSSFLVGGPIKWKTDQVRFKHMNTGHYLVMQMKNELYKEEASTELIYTTTPDMNEPGTLFNVSELNSTGKLLSNGKALQIGNNGFWIERGDNVEGSVFTFGVQGTRDKGMAVSLIINRFSDDTAAEEDESEVKEPLDAFVGLSARNFLRKYYDMTVIPRSDSINTLWPSSIRSDIDFFQFVVRQTVFFSQGFPISANDVQLGIDKADSGLRKRRQTLLREQNTLEVVLRLINKLIPMTEKLELSKKVTNKKNKSVLSDEQLAVVNMGQSILRRCFNLLYYSIVDHPENQMYVADFMPVLLAHLNAQPLAGKCVTEMLSKNIELQETKIGTREIQIFVDKLRSSKMNAMYLQLLQACCSCEGAGVDGNQCKVATMLFSDTNDIIIQLHADYNHVINAVWSQPSLYIPPSPIPGSPVRGDTLITKGLPQLSLAWTTNSIDFSPLGLFGKLSVNVDELFRPDDALTVVDEAGDKKGALKKLKSKKKSAAEQKEAVANYFIAELFLGAEMCMDRNYIAMHQLDALFPYEVLVTIVKMNVSSRLKSAAVRLLMCLHVDRDPQATSKIPCLTRTWSEIKKNAVPQLPYVDVGRRYMFGLIQQMISEHIREMAGSQWNELSRNMLKMLRTLIQFNFYGTNERMKDVIGPLIAALDRRRVGDGRRTMDRQASIRHVRSQQSMENVSKELEDLSKEEEKLMETDYLDFTRETEDDQSKRWYQIFIRGCCTLMYNMCNMGGAARVIAGLDLENRSDQLVEGFQNPLRYSKAPIYELETMVEAVDILAFTQRVIEDRNISLLLHYFHEWESGVDKRSPAELFEQVVADSAELSLNIEDFDNVMIDVLMFVHTPLVQSTLEVLMAHHSMRRILLDNIFSVQLLASHKRERQFKMVDQMLQQLEQNAETHELWGELESDADRLVNKQTQDILRELADICKIRRKVLEFDEDFMADVEIQNLFRNLGCFEICLKVMGLMDSVEEDENGELGEVALNTRHLCLLCNTLLYWFLLGNPKNQELGYQELDFFLDTLDDEIKSHLVLGAIFKNNESLMRQVPHSALSDMVDKIVKNGKSHHYLSLFANISHVGEKNLVENQFQIVKTLTSPGIIEKLGCFLVPVTDPSYDEKRDLMAPYLKRHEDLTFDDLPPLLAYHLSFLNVLSGCTVGRLNITTVEAKVQSVFNYVDIIASILDPGTILLAKIVMSRFLFNAVVEVELLIPGIERAPLFWRLFDSYQNVFAEMKDDVLSAMKLGWEGVSRQKIEYSLVCMMIVGGFFSRYFDASIFRSGRSSGGRGKTEISKARVNRMIVNFFHKLKEVYDLDTPLLSTEIKEQMGTTLTVLKDLAPKYIHQPIRRLKSVRSEKSKASRGQSRSDLLILESVKIKTMSENAAKDDAESKLIGKFHKFLKEIEGDSSILYKAENENVAFISILEQLPFIQDPVESDVRYETLIRKLVSHIRENITIVNNQKRMDARVTKTSSWIIRAFRTMIENRMGMSIYERDDEGGQEQDEAAAPVVNALNSCGATALCLDLIADGIDEELQVEAVKLGVGLLFKEGGALEVQGIMNNHLSKTNSELFFKQVRLTLQKLQAWHTWNEVIVLEDGEEPNLPDEILIIRFLQLMCEGHYLPNQDIMREQPNNAVSYNLLDDYVNYLNCLSRIPCRTSSVAAIRMSATILEVIQGPCEGNQLHFALNTELVESLNRLNRAKLVNDCVEDEEIELKKTSIDIFQGLLEGQGEKSVVYDRVLSVVHLDIIHMMSKRQTLTDGSEEDSKKEVSEDQVILQTECVVLLQMFCNFKPSLYEELGISRNIEDIVGSGTAMIEVIWRGDIHRRFFHVPKICDFLAKSSKDSLVENVDRSNAENKLIDFLNRSHELYREVKHQQLLTDMNLSRIFSRANQNRATWITFFLSILINALFLFYYSNRSGEPSVSPFINEFTTVLNGLQAFVALFTLLLWLVVRSPVNYQTISASNIGELRTIVYTATDPLTVYYVIYLVISGLGVWVENYYVSLLLLDIIVKNSVTRDVLMSIVTPRKQLGMALLLAVFVIYIYSFFIFFFYQEDIDFFCDTLWNCVKTTMSYGLQNGGGIADVFSHATGYRLILDLTFFCVVIVILLNVIFGIIIDTFSSLRVDKARRVQDTLEICFICGINKQIFDRASDEPDGFKNHIKLDHNMWNYLYFIFMLWEQDKDDDDGMEQYVRRAIDANEITWFPQNKAMRLDQIASASETLRKELKESVKVTEGNISSKMDDFKEDVGLMFRQLMQTLRQETHETMLTRTDMSTFSEEEAFDDGTVLTECSFLGDLVLGHHVSVGLIDIEGVALNTNDLRMISCRVISDTGMYSFQNIAVENGKVLFDRFNLVPLFDNVQPEDHRLFQLQILQVVGEEKQFIKFISVLEISAVDLLTELEDGVLTKKFTRMDQSEVCSVRLTCESFEAKTFGRSQGVSSRNSTPKHSVLSGESKNA